MEKSIAAVSATRSAERKKKAKQGVVAGTFFFIRNTYFINWYILCHLHFSPPTFFLLTYYLFPFFTFPILYKYVMIIYYPIDACNLEDREFVFVFILYWPSFLNRCDTQDPLHYQQWWMFNLDASYATSEEVLIRIIFTIIFYLNSLTFIFTWNSDILSCFLSISYSSFQP